MKLLLASAGITNASIKAGLIDLLGKPIADSTALCIPTASSGMAGVEVISRATGDCPNTDPANCVEN